LPDLSIHKNPVEKTMDMKVLGIESTAHTLGIGVVDEEEVLVNEKDMYEPEEGGFRPREAAEHHYKKFLEILDRAESESGIGVSEVDAVAFSRGPGLPQCLDTGAVAARTLTKKHDMPLVGVNHCLAHISIGTRTTGADDPVTLYVSGGNTQVLFRRSGRYRVVGETLDIAAGNAVDKLARRLDIPYPGGPEIESLAKETEEVFEASYPVKGMDFSFSGLVTELKRSHHDKEVVANTFQEHAYAALVEGLERAMSQEDADEALLTGGVAMNDRLRDMIQTMCKERGAEFHVPDPEFCMDNGAMIAHEGLLRLKQGKRTPVSAKTLPDWRPDEVELSA